MAPALCWDNSRSSQWLSRNDTKRLLWIQVKPSHRQTSWSSVTEALLIASRNRNSGKRTTTACRRHNHTGRTSSQCMSQRCGQRDNWTTTQMVAKLSTFLWPNSIKSPLPTTSKNWSKISPTGSMKIITMRLNRPHSIVKNCFLLWFNWNNTTRLY